MRARRRVVDYSLKRRALLRDVYAGRVSLFEVCDASPYLKNAAKYHGEMIDVRCPICRRENLWHVHYIYVDALGASAGQRVAVDVVHAPEVLPAADGAPHVDHLLDARG